MLQDVVGWHRLLRWQSRWHRCIAFTRHAHSNSTLLCADDEKALYEQGVHVGAIGLIAQAVVSTATAYLLPHLNGPEHAEGERVLRSLVTE